MTLALPSILLSTIHTTSYSFQCALFVCVTYVLRMRNLFGNPALVQLATNAAEHAVQELSGGQLHLSRSNVFSLPEILVYVVFAVQCIRWLFSALNVNVASFLQGLHLQPQQSRSHATFGNLSDSQHLAEQCARSNDAQLAVIAQQQGVTIQQLQLWVSSWNTHLQSLQLLAVRIHPLPFQQAPVFDGAGPSESAKLDSFPALCPSERNESQRSGRHRESSSRRFPANGAAKRPEAPAPPRKSESSSWPGGPSPNGTNTPVGTHRSWTPSART